MSEMYFLNSQMWLHDKSEMSLFPKEIHCFGRSHSCDISICCCSGCWGALPGFPYYPCHQREPPCPKSYCGEPTSKDCLIWDTKARLPCLSLGHMFKVIPDSKFFVALVKAFGVTTWQINFSLCPICFSHVPTEALPSKISSYKSIRVWNLSFFYLQTKS